MKIKSILKLSVIFLGVSLFLSQYAFADIYDDFNDGVIDTKEQVKEWGKSIGEGSLLGSGVAEVIAFGDNEMTFGRNEKEK